MKKNVTNLAQPSEIVMKCGQNQTHIQSSRRPGSLPCRRNAHTHKLAVRHPGVCVCLKVDVKWALSGRHIAGSTQVKWSAARQGCQVSSRRLFWLSETKIRTRHTLRPVCISIKQRAHFILGQMNEISSAVFDFD